MHLESGQRISCSLSSAHPCTVRCIPAFVHSCLTREALRGAFPFHHLRRELARFGEVDEVLGPCACSAVICCRSFSSAVTRGNLDALEEGGRRLPGRLLAAVEVDQPFDRLRECGAPGSSPPSARSSRRPSSCLRPPSRNTAAPHVPPMRRTLPWKPIVAMWCWPQPFGQPLILICAPSASAIEIGTRPQRVLEQAAESSRLRHGEPAAIPRRDSCRRPPRSPPPPARGWLPRDGDTARARRRSGPIAGPGSDPP